MPRNYYDDYCLLDSETASWCYKDPETGVLDTKHRTPNDAHTRLIQYSVNGGPVVVLDLYTDEGKAGLETLREYADGEMLVVIQNANYDIPFLRKQGIHFHRFFDTQVASQIINAGIPTDNDLGSLMFRNLGKRPYDEIGREQIDAEADVIRKESHAYNAAHDEWIKEREINPDAKCALPCPFLYFNDQEVDEWVAMRLQGMKKELQKSDWSLPTLTPEQLAYAAMDVGPEFDELYLLLRDRIANGGFQGVFDLDMQVLPIVAEMAENGIKHNLYKWFDYIEGKRTELATIEEQIGRTCDTLMQILHPDYYMITLRRRKPLAGKPAKVLKDGTVKTVEVPEQSIGDLMSVQAQPKLTALYEVLPHLVAMERGDYRVGSFIRAELGLAAGDTFNFGSAQQMRKLIDEMMDVEWDAKHNFDDKAVEDLKKIAEAKDNQEVVDLLTLHQEAQGLRKLTQTYGESYWNTADSGGYIHSSFTLAQTDTARMSSRDPNLQNLPRGMQKMLWSCEQDEVIIKADYSAQELRLLLFLGKQDDMYKRVLEGMDAHSMSASFMLGIPYNKLVDKVEGKKDKVKPEYEASRSRAKVVTFAPAYGAGPKRLSEALGSDYKTAKKFYTSYWKTYDKVKIMQDRQVTSAIELGFVTDLSFGRLRWFVPTLLDQERLDAGETRDEVLGRFAAAASNFACQCTGGTMLRFAMLKVDKWIKRNPQTGAKIRLAVHDALILTCKPEYQTEVSEALAELMEASASEVVPGIDIPVDVDIIDDHTAPAVFTLGGYEIWKANHPKPDADTVG